MFRRYGEYKTYSSVKLPGDMSGNPKVRRKKCRAIGQAVRRRPLTMEAGV
jgi:hypothetical protein